MPSAQTVAALAAAVLLALLGPATAAHAQNLGIATLGATGGLTMPSAFVLGSGDLAFTGGNYQDPALGSYNTHQNYTLGVGLLPGVEVFGRFADYTTSLGAPPGAPDAAGIRDISANFKWQLPLPLLFDAPWLPKVAVGATDVSGGAVFFQSAYAVASDDIGPVRWSLGYAQGKAALGQADGAKVLDGAFGGVEVKLGSTGATALAEASGSQRHAGLRYYSDPLPWLWSSQLVGTVQRSVGATTPAGGAADASSFNVSLIVPLGAPDKSRRARADADAAARPLPALATPDAPAAPAASGGMVATPQDRLDTLARALRATGLDRVRVGLLGDVLVVDYENYRYLHNETDGLGVVLGLAAEAAPTGTARVHAITRKLGLAVLQTTVEVAAYQRFLRDGDSGPVSASMAFGALPGNGEDAVQWAAGEAGAGARGTWVRLQLQPLLNFALGTEYGAFDYSLAAQLRASVPLWQGAEAYVDGVQRLATSDNMAPGRIFASSRHTNGLMTAALQQSLWLGPRVFASVGAGQYNYDYLGAEGVSILYLPWNGDSVHLKGSYQRSQTDVLPRTVEAYAGSYRWQFNPQTWVEAGYQQYTDTSTGPSVALTRWFGDVAVQLFARKGGNNTFVGLELSLPLTPRQGMGAEVVQLTGTPRYAQSIRTRLTNASNAGNYVDSAAVRSVSTSLAYKPEVELLNSGRITPDDIRGQVQRMRESFYLYGRDQIKPLS